MVNSQSIRVKVGANGTRGETARFATKNKWVTLLCLHSSPLQLGRWSVGFGGQQRDWTGLKGWVMALLLEECLTVLSDGSLQVSEVIVYRLPGFPDRVS